MRFVSGETEKIKNTDAPDIKRRGVNLVVPLFFGKIPSFRHNSMPYPCNGGIRLRLLIS